MAVDTQLPTVPTSDDDDEEDGAAAGGVPSVRGMGGRSTGEARTPNSEDYDPWMRRDPWGRGDRRGQGSHDPEYIQFLQWRQGQEGRGMWGSHSPWHFARDEHERTTAGPPPEWDGDNLDFKDYKLKAKIWLRTTRTPPAARGPLLLKSLSKGPWEDLKFLAGQEEWLTDPKNGEKLIDLMNTKEFYGEELREDMLAACSRITFHIRRQKGEKARTFLTRWDNAERKVREHGVALPAEFLGFLLVNALSLDSEKVKQMLQYTKGGLKVTDIKEWLRVQEADLDMTSLGNEKKKTTGHYMLEPEEVHAMQHIPEEHEVSDDEEPVDVLLTAFNELEDGGEELPSVEFTEAEAQEILMTMVKDKQNKKNHRTFAGSKHAKNNRDLARGFGAGRSGVLRPGSYKVSIEEIKKRTKCNNCNEVGHWHRECPRKSRGGANNPKNNKSQEMHYLETFQEAEIFMTEHHRDDPGGGDFIAEYDMGICPTHRVDPCEEGWQQFQPSVFPPQMRSDDASSASRAYMLPRTISQVWDCFQVEVPLESQCATLDTGCQRMAIGINTLNRLSETQPRELPIRFHYETHSFRSVHQVSTTHRVAHIPTSLGRRGSVLKPAVFEENLGADAPFLLSLPFLRHCQAVLHLDSHKGLQLVSERYQFSVQLHLGPSGALRVPLQDFSKEMFQFLQDRESQHGNEYELFQVNAITDFTATSRPKHSIDPRRSLQTSVVASSDRHGVLVQEQAGAYGGHDIPLPPGLETVGSQADRHHESFHHPAHAEADGSSGTCRTSGQADGGRSPSSQHRGPRGSDRGSEFSSSRMPTGSQGTHHEESNTERMVSSVFSGMGPTGNGRSRRQPEEPISINHFLKDGTSDSASSSSTRWSAPELSANSGVDRHGRCSSRPGASDSKDDPRSTTVLLSVPSSHEVGNDREEPQPHLLEMLPQEGGSQRPGLCLFHMGSPATSSPRKTRRSGSGDLRSESVHSSRDVQGGEQLLCAQGEVRDLWPGHPEREDQLWRGGNDEQTFPRPQDGGCQGQPPSGDRPGVPGLSGVAAPASPTESSFELNMESGGSTVQRLRDEGRGQSLVELQQLLSGDIDTADERDFQETGVFPCPVGLRRHIFGALKRKGMLWTDLGKYLCHPGIKNDEQHISEVSFLIRQALQKQLAA